MLEMVISQQLSHKLFDFEEFGVLVVAEGGFVINTATGSRNMVVSRQWPSF